MGFRVWDLGVAEFWGLGYTKVIHKVNILIKTYNPVRVLITLLTKSHDPPSSLRVWGLGFRVELGSHGVLRF